MMKRVLSQPIVWKSSPNSQRYRSNTELTTSLRPSVKWDEPSERKVDSPLSLSRSFSKHEYMTEGSRRLQIDSKEAIEVGGYNAGDNLHLQHVAMPQSKVLEKLALRYAAISTGHAGPTCAKFVSESLEQCLARAVEEAGSLDNVEALFREGFKSCEGEFNRQFPRDTSGASALVAVVHGHSVHIGWVGDCRAVVSCGNEIKPISWEHLATNPMERKRIIDNGGLVAGGQIAGILPTSRGFGENDVKTHLPDGVFIADPSVTTVSVEEAALLAKQCFVIMASQSVFTVFSNEAACKIVSKILSKSGASPNDAAKKLASLAQTKSKQECTVCVITWADTTPRTRSSSSLSWRSLRSPSTTFEDEDAHDTS